MGSVGYTDIRIEEMVIQEQIATGDYIEKVRNKYISTLSLIRWRAICRGHGKVGKGTAQKIRGEDGLREPIHDRRWKEDRRALPPTWCYEGHQELGGASLIILLRPTLEELGVNLSTITGLLCPC